MNNDKLELVEKSAFEGSLGTKCTENGTTFRLWQPNAQSVELRLYNDQGTPIKSVPMRRCREGVFESRVRGDLDGVEYAFSVTANGKTAECPDPYSKSVTADRKRSVVVNMRRHSPKGWTLDRPISFPNSESAVIYEVSVRDFSSDECAGFKNRGKFAAFCERGVRNSYNETVGLSYIQKFGATHIQLLPLFDFDLDGTDYNWGYNPLFYNTPSLCYTQNDGVLEMRSLVAAAHRKGLGVVMDVVYNHVYDAGNSVFEQILPGYYFRADEKTGGFSNGSGCGNEFASERKMAGKFIVDSLVFWAREYHLDGFRFDLMGLIDIDTLREAETKLRRINPDILLYGEGWTGGESSLSVDRRAIMSNARELPNFAFFNDNFRDAVKGSVFEVSEGGFVNDSPNDENTKSIQSVLSGIFPENYWTNDSRQCVNFVECHDNFTLFDKLGKSLKNADIGRIKQADKMAAALILLSRGMAFIQAGQEFLRSKNGIGNSYNSPDSVNSIKWDNLYENRDVAEYYKGMVAFRKRYLPQFGEHVFERAGEGFVMMAGDFILIASPTEEEIAVDISGTFKIFADGKRASNVPLYTSDRLCCKGFSILLAGRI